MDQKNTNIQNSAPKKWEAKVSTTVKKATADQVWAFYKDFFNFHKWFPGAQTCTGVSGINGDPGCIRVCSSTVDLLGSDIRWAKERLLTVDDEERFMSYDIVENNIGFESYVSTVKIVPEGDGCVIEWGFTVDPVEGWALDDLVKHVYEDGLVAMAKRMEDAAIAS